MELTPQLRQYYQKSIESMQRKHYEYAVETLKAVVEGAPDHAPAHELLLKALRARFERKPPHPARKLIYVIIAELSLWIARIFVVTKNIQAARPFLLRGLICSPRHRGILTEWLNLSRKEGRLDISIVAAEALITECPKDERIYLELARLYFQKGNTDKAKEVVERGMRSLPSSALLVRRFKEIEAERTMQQGDWDQPGA